MRTIQYKYLVSIAVLVLFIGAAVYWSLSRFIAGDWVASSFVGIACNGKKDPLYPAYGIEHRYQGVITIGKPVTMILSCDHTILRVAGSVQQDIHATDVPDALRNSLSGLADLTSGTEVIGVDNDYNFDGYNDLETIINNGQGQDAIKDHLIFLYDPQTNRFVYNAGVSARISGAQQKENER